MACHHERHCDINLIMNEKENREFFKIKDRKMVYIVIALSD